MNNIQNETKEQKFLNTLMTENEFCRITNKDVKNIAESLNTYYDKKDYMGKIMDAIAFQSFLLNKGYKFEEMKKIFNYILDDINRHDPDYLT